MPSSSWQSGVGRRAAEESDEEGAEEEGEDEEGDGEDDGENVEDDGDDEEDVRAGGAGGMEQLEEASGIACGGTPRNLTFSRGPFTGVCCRSHRTMLPCLGSGEGI